MSSFENVVSFDHIRYDEKKVSHAIFSFIANVASNCGNVHLLTAAGCSELFDYAKELCSHLPYSAEYLQNIKEKN